MNLRIPGPIPVPDDILEAMARPMINHRGPVFKEMLYRVTGRLKQVFETESDVYILTSSGTGAMEAAVANTLSPGDKVVCASVGSFGDRFGQIAQTFGADVVMCSFPPGTAIDPDGLRSTLSVDPEIKAVLVTHNETNSGVTNDLEAVARVVKGEFDKLLIVDGISSVCSLPLHTDAWGCDVVASASQKGWMLPPGLAFLSFSDRAWEAHAQSTMPRFYFDMSQYKKFYEIGQPPYTPALSAIFALDLALQKILDEGMESVYRRHAEIGQMTRDGIKRLGLDAIPRRERCLRYRHRGTGPRGGGCRPAPSRGARGPRCGTCGRLRGADRQDLQDRAPGIRGSSGDQRHAGRAGSSTPQGRVRD